MDISSKSEDSDVASEISHPPRSSFACQFCSFSFSRNDNRIRHEKKCDKDMKNAESSNRSRANKCPSCEREFSRADSLRRHVRICEGSSSRKRRCENSDSDSEPIKFSPVECEICKNKFNRLDSLKRHVKICSLDKK